MLKMTLIYSHDLPAIELTGGSISEHKKARAAVINDYMYSEDYLKRTIAGAFLQGQSDDTTDLWTLIEFWKDDYAPFVEMIEARLGVKCD